MQKQIKKQTPSLSLALLCYIDNYLSFSQGITKCQQQQTNYVRIEQQQPEANKLKSLQYKHDYMLGKQNTGEAKQNK